MSAGEDNFQNFCCFLLLPFFKGKKSTGIIKALEVRALHRSAFLLACSDWDMYGYNFEHFYV